MPTYRTTIEVKIEFDAKNIDEADIFLNEMDYEFRHNGKTLQTEIMDNGYPWDIDSPESIV